ncbi:MAG TPA: isochorismate synthase [Acidimicrobiales bacterium]|nr:isochorismate synthase [Acidimicrobiales bacterium]
MTPGARSGSVDTSSPTRPDVEVARAAGLVARTVAIPDDDVDLLDFAGDDGLLFEREGCGLAGRGVALRVDAAAADDVLAAMTSRDDVGRPGCGPIALGALPFDPASVATVVVPREVLGRSPDGAAWYTVVSAEGDDPGPSWVSRHPDEADRPRPPDDFRLTAARPHQEWVDAIAAAVDTIASGRLRKVVLAREVTVEANRRIHPVDVLGRLRALYPSCMIFSVEGFVGASPELLVGRFGDAVRSQPMAGTIPRSGDPTVDARLAAGLLASPKDREEHALVVEEVAAGLTPYCASLDVPAAPSIVPLRNVSHLGTLLTGVVAAGAPSAIRLARALHPTPAVAGTPTADAVAYIAAVEGLDRGRFAGPVGWVDANGDGEWAVGVRSAELDGNRARLFAGVGVVADSEPEAELAETQLKLQALLAAVVRP